jgi:hypothetical protein
MAACSPALSHHTLGFAGNRIDVPRDWHSLLLLPFIHAPGPSGRRVSLPCSELISLFLHGRCDISEQASSLCGEGQHEDAVPTEQSLTGSQSTGT